MYVPIFEQGFGLGAGLPLTMGIGLLFGLDIEHIFLIDMARISELSIIR